MIWFSRMARWTLSIISTVRSAPQPKKNGLLCWLGGGGAVARVPSLVASCAPLLTPFCASRASFLTPFGAPARRSCRRSVPDFAVSVGGVVGAAGVGVVWASAFDTVRIAAEATSPNAAAYPRMRVRCDDNPALTPTVHSFPGSRFAAPEHVT